MTKQKPISSRIKKRETPKAMAFRIPEPLYEKVKAKAAKDGVTVTAILIAAFEQYLEGK